MRSARTEIDIALEAKRIHAALNVQTLGHAVIAEQRVRDEQHAREARVGEPFGQLDGAHAQRLEHETKARRLREVELDQKAAERNRNVSLDRQAQARKVADEREALGHRHAWALARGGGKGGKIRQGTCIEPVEYHVGEQGGA